jgi:dynein heavy chain
VNDEKETDLTKPPEDGVHVYGLFVEGCRWNEEKAALDESMPKVLYTAMKTIHILPKKKTEINHGHSYMCPVYKTSARFGTLTTTGHSSNFVVDIYIPMQKKHKERHWIKRGVAMLTSLND